MLTGRRGVVVELLTDEGSRDALSVELETLGDRPAVTVTSTRRTSSDDSVTTTASVSRTRSARSVNYGCAG
jgi:hypothetical protein